MKNKLKRSVNVIQLDSPKKEGEFVYIVTKAWNVFHVHLNDQLTRDECIALIDDGISVAVLPSKGGRS